MNKVKVVLSSLLLLTASLSLHAANAKKTRHHVYRAKMKTATPRCIHQHMIFPTASGIPLWGIKHCGQLSIEIKQSYDPGSLNLLDCFTESSRQHFLSCYVLYPNHEQRHLLIPTPQNVNGAFTASVQIPPISVTYCDGSQGQGYLEGVYSLVIEPESPSNIQTAQGLPDTISIMQTMGGIRKEISRFVTAAALERRIEKNSPSYFQAFSSYLDAVIEPTNSQTQLPTSQRRYTFSLMRDVDCGTV